MGCTARKEPFRPDHTFPKRKRLIDAAKVVRGDIDEKEVIERTLAEYEMHTSFTWLRAAFWFARGHDRPDHFFRLAIRAGPQNAAG